MEQEGNEPYIPLANDGGSTGGSADHLWLKATKRWHAWTRPLNAWSTYSAINRQSKTTVRHWPRRWLRSYTHLSGFEDIQFKWMVRSINTIRETVLTDKRNLRKLRKDVLQAASIIITSACLLFIKHPATTPWTKEIQRTICLLPVIFDLNLFLDILLRVVVGFHVTRFRRGSSYMTVSSKRHSVLHGTQLYITAQWKKDPSVIIYSR